MSAPPEHPTLEKLGKRARAEKRGAAAFPPPDELREYARLCSLQGIGQLHMRSPDGCEVSITMAPPVYQNIGEAPEPRRAARVRPLRPVQQEPAPDLDTSRPPAWEVPFEAPAPDAVPEPAEKPDPTVEGTGFTAEELFHSAG